MQFTELVKIVGDDGNVKLAERHIAEVAPKNTAALGRITRGLRDAGVTYWGCPNVLFITFEH